MLPAPIDSPVDHLGSRAKEVRLLHGAGLHAQQVPHRTDVAVVDCPKNVPVASARAATPLQPTSPKWLTVHRLGELLTAVVQKPLNDSIFRLPYIINKNALTFGVITISHHAFLLPTSEAPAPFGFLFFCRNESEIVSSTSLHLFHCPEGLSVEPMSTTSPGPVEPRCLVEPHS